MNPMLHADNSKYTVCQGLRELHTFHSESVVLLHMSFGYICLAKAQLTWDFQLGGLGCVSS